MPPGSDKADGGIRVVIGSLEAFRPRCGKNVFFTRTGVRSARTGFAAGQNGAERVGRFPIRRISMLLRITGLAGSRASAASKDERARAPSPRSM